MITNFLIIPRITPPGSGEISVKYRPNVAYQVPMVDYNGGRILQGSLVRFTVTTSLNFQLTSWKAMYFDDYGGSVEVPLTGIQGEQTWEFTMPSHDVAIICETTSTPGYPTSEFHYQFPGQYLRKSQYGAINVTTFSSLDELVAAASNFGFTINITSTALRNRLAQYFNTFNTIVFDITFPYFTVWTANVDYTSPKPGAEDIVYTFHRMSNRYWEFSDSSFDDHGYGWSTDETFYNEPHGLTIGITGGVATFGTSNIKSCTIVDISGQPELMSSIEYIFNPSSSGEITDGSPVEFTQGTEEFMFKWRIKTGYSLKRITPFAIGESSLEDDVVYSSEYDGETRTYTVVVQQIPIWAKGIRVIIECNNENDPNVGGDSIPGGGDGSFDETSDPIPLEPMPTISAADAGLITLFRPTLAELKQLGAYLWTNIEDFIDNIKKMFSNPMDTMIALNIIPGIPPVGPARNIRLGIWETNIAMSPVLSQWYEIDFGSVTIKEFWGSALDYSPNTKIHAMLPFIGSVQLDTDDVMGKTLSLVYRIDLLSGHLVAIIMVNDDILYQFTGECAVSVPLTGADWSRVYGAIAGTIGAVAIGAAGAAAAGNAMAGLSQSAAAAQHVAAQADFDYMSAAISGASQNQLRALDSSARKLNAAAMNAVGRRNVAEASKMAGAVALGSNTVNQIMGAKVQIAHSGTISGSAGLLGLRRPYIYIEYPNQSLPNNYKHFYGYPSNMYANLGSLKGFTQCYQVLLTGVNGTDGEIAEILELLKEGVYL